MAANTASSSKDALKTAVSDLSSLGRVGHRLAMLDSSAKLQSVLDKLLARLLLRIGDNHKQQSLADQNNKVLLDTLSKIHQKLVEILSHAMKRVRDDRSVKLNCESILTSLLLEEDRKTAKASTNPFTLNLSLAFLTLGVPRCSETELKSLMPSLIILHGHYANQALQTNNVTAKSHWHQISHLLVHSLESSVGNEQGQVSKKAKISNSPSRPPPSQMISATSSPTDGGGPTIGNTACSSGKNSAMERIHQVLSEDSTAASALYDLLLDIILYQSTAGAVPPAGCSEAGQQRLQSNKAWVAEMAPPARLSLFKTRVLEWIAPTLQSCLFPQDSARSYTLLLAASGDANHQQVTNQASLYLKHFLDDAGQQKGKIDSETYLTLIMELLILCVGCNNALLALGSTSLPSLGLDLSASPANVMPFRRRMVSDTTFAAMMMHVDKILTDTPQLFYAPKDPTMMERIGRLAVLAVSKMVAKLRTSTGLTTLRGRPYISAVQVMNALVIRFLATLENQDQLLPIDNRERIESLLAKALALSCTSLSNTIVATSSTSTNLSTSNEGNLSVRDALYGVICSLSRSSTLVSDSTSWLFALGKVQEKAVSIETATLLFSCVAKEEQKLLPRANAALDAVLAAFCRTTATTVVEPTIAEEKKQSDNPWSNIAPAPMETDGSMNSGSAIAQGDQLAKLLLPLLWSASQISQTKSSRLAAARWSRELLKKLDLINACHILCFLSGDKDTTVASIARRGLDLDEAAQSSSQEEATTQEEEVDKDTAKLGDFSVLCKLLFSDRQATGVRRPNYWEFAPKAKASAIAYLLKCLLDDFYGIDDGAVYTYMDALTKSLLQVTNLGRDYVELLDECSASLAACISTSLFGRRLIFGHEERTLGVGLKDMQQVVFNASSSAARRELADACGSIYGDPDLWSQDEWLSSILDLMVQCLEVLENSTGTKLGSIHGAAFLGATCVKQYRLNPSFANSDQGWELSCRILTSLGKRATVADDMIGKANTDGLAVALSYDNAIDDAPSFDSRLQTGTKSALSSLVSALQKYGGDEHTDVSRAAKVADAMGVCLEATIPFSGSKEENDALHGCRLQCIEVLLSMLGSAAYRKDEEIALRVGEALAAYAWVPKGLAWQSSGADTWPNEMDTEFSKTLPPHQQVIYTLLRGAKLTSNPMKRTAYAPVLLALVARAAARVNHDSSYATTGLVQELCHHLDNFQSAFISILSDPKSKHLCRESCCLGLAACRSLAKLGNGGDAANETLLRAFGQTTNHGTSAMQETRDQANRRRMEEGRADGENAGSTAEAIGMETDVGGAAGMSEASLGAYREMAEAAVSLGRPDVLYTLFMLSVTHPIWFSTEGRERYGPSAILGENSIIGSRTNSAELRLALRPHLGKIMPRLLRASHDPNKQTREQIQNLWNGLTGGGADARMAISQHLLPIIDSLIADTSHKLWRARVGATGALAQVIVGRSWNELGGGPGVLDDDDILSNASTSSAGIRLLKLWNISMRSLDDVRATVRESGETLARGVRSLTLRLCDPAVTDDSDKSHARDSVAAAATSLRWLVKHGLNQPCAEATGVSVSCLVGVIKVVNPSILQPLIPELLRSLLLAMSSLEPAALNYLQVRAAGQGTGADSSYGTIERLRLQVAQSGPLATAVAKLLDMVPHVDVEAQRAVIPQLNSALRQSAGFTTRAAVADACATLCNLCPNAFKFSGSNSTNPAVGLMRGFFYGAERESGAGARSKMAHAFGSLAALCPGSSVRSLALRACDNYNSATGANHDPAIRLASAIALRSIAVRAQNQFSDGGNNDVWCRRVLPVSYLGMRDSDKKVAQLWKEVWEEGGSAANLAGAVDDYGTVLEEKLLVSLVKECDKALSDVSWSRRASGAAALNELADLRILAPLQSRKKSGKPDNLFLGSERSERRRQGSQIALTILVKVLGGSRLWSGKNEVAKAAVRIASNWSTEDCDEGEATSTSGAVTKENPVSLESKVDCNDLFVGDDWFRQEHEDDLDVEPMQTAKKELEDGNIESDLAEGSDVDGIAAAVVEDALRLVPVTFVGLCRLLVTQAFPTSRVLLSVSEEDVLPYRAAVLQALTDLLNSVDGNDLGDALKRTVYETISQNLLPVFDAVSVSSEGTLKEPPLVVARSLDCFAACLWRGIGSESDTVDPLELAKIVFRCLEQPAWTVRESATLCNSSLVLRCHLLPLCQFELPALMVTCASQVAKDRKFWRVRLAGMKLLHSLVTRTGNAPVGDSMTTSNVAARERQEFLESMLPHKEKILKLAKLSLSDPEAKVTALASEALKAMTWWP